jgi:hypothetical protein
MRLFGHHEALEIAVIVRKRDTARCHVSNRYEGICTEAVGGAQESIKTGGCGICPSSKSTPHYCSPESGARDRLPEHCRGYVLSIRPLESRGCFSSNSLFYSWK